MGTVFLIILTFTIIHVWCVCMCVCFHVLFISLGSAPPLQAQRQDLIAELKMSKDINGIKKMKVEKVKMDEMSEKQKINEITKQLSPDNIIDQVNMITLYLSKNKIHIVILEFNGMLKGNIIEIFINF